LRRSRIQIRLQVRHQVGHTKQGLQGTKIESRTSTAEDQVEEVRCKKTEAHTGGPENPARPEKGDGVVELDGLQAQEIWMSMSTKEADSAKSGLEGAPSAVAVVLVPTLACDRTP
jgi:hypothetical protein